MAATIAWYTLKDTNIQSYNEAYTKCADKSVSDKDCMKLIVNEHDYINRVNLMNARFK